MPNKEVIENAVKTANEVVAEKTDTTGLIFMGAGFLAGAALTIVTVHVVPKKLKARKAAKAAKKAEPAAE